MLSLFALAVSIFALIVAIYAAITIELRNRKFRPGILTTRHIARALEQMRNAK